MTEEEIEELKKKKKARARFATGTRPSMLRRSDYHDYTERRMYLITLTTDGRQPLLGTLMGGTDAPYVSPTPLGQAVISQWMGIHAYYPQITVVAACLMPDHFHGILFVQEQLPVHLGQVIRGFKQGCTKEYWRIAAMNRDPQQPAAINGTPPQPVPVGRDSSRQVVVGRDSSRQVVVGRDSSRQVVVGRDSSRLVPEVRDSSRPSLWSPGYNDRILKEQGQLQRWIDYLRDNPYRLAMKRAHPDLFRVTTSLPLFGINFSALGNLFLLRKPEKLQVQCTRKLPAEEIEKQKNQFLARSKEGAVLVSPSISDGERVIIEAAYEAGGSIILLMKKGFHQLQKPPKHFFDACAEGRLLWLSPFAYSNRPIPLRRECCLILNEYARRICEEL